MKKALIFSVAVAASIFLAGCATPPEVVIDAPPTLLDIFQISADQVIAVGGLAVVGEGSSQSLELALNQAKANGRVELGEQLKATIQALKQDFFQEAALAGDVLPPDPFQGAAEGIISQAVQDASAQELKYEVTDGRITAYALMELDPAVIIAKFAEETGLYTRFQTTRTFEQLSQRAQNYEDFKTGLPLTSD